MKKIVFLIFMFILMISNVNALSITSLGDSIPNGYLLANKNDSYDNLLASKLEAKLYEFTRPGMNTYELLEELNKNEIKESIQSSDIIIVNIGANDLLDLIDLIDFSSLGFDKNGNISKNDLNKDIISKLTNNLQSTFVEVLKPKSIEALTKFSNIFPQVIKKIKEYNPNIKIYVNNIYNPFFDISLPLLGLNLDKIQTVSDDAIKAFNEVISSDNSYKVMDLYTNLRNNNYLNVNILEGSLDPHPNKIGHEKIYELYLKELCYKITYEDKDYYVIKGDKFNIEPPKRQGYTFKKWNYDLDKIDQDIVLKPIYKKNINYLYFIIPGVLVIAIIILIKKNK